MSDKTSNGGGWLTADLHKQWAAIFHADQAKAAKDEGRVYRTPATDAKPRFNTLRDRDQYYAACAELRAAEHAMDIAQAAVDRERHEANLGPLLRVVEEHQQRIMGLRNVIRGLLSSAEGDTA